MAGRKTEAVKPERPSATERSNQEGMTEGEGLNELETVDRLLSELESKIREKSFKPAVADLIRLLLLRRDLEEEQPKEITVQWVEPEMDGEKPIAG